MKKLSLLIFLILFINSLSAQTVDSIIDIRDNQVYKVVKIGQQWWMQENLNVGIMIDSTQFATDNSVIEKYCYRNNLCNIYGGLYQWDEMMDYNFSDDGNPGTIRGICPGGWHLPTDNEWAELTDYLGGEYVAGGMLKETGTTHWVSPNTGATNGSGFTALPGGFHYSDDFFYGIGNYSYSWSATDVNTLLAWYWLLPYNDPYIYHGYSTYVKESGLSVRCLRDIDQYSYLFINDRNFRSVSKLDFINCETIDTLLIINSGAGKTINVTSIQTATSAYNLNKSSIVLLPGDSIHLVVSFIPPKKGTYYFDTLLIESDDPFIPEISVPLMGYFPETDSIIDIRDNQIYKVVKIGQQWWMQENLNFGIQIDKNKDATDNGIPEKWCFNDCSIYGGLYRWNEMMDYYPSNNGNPGTVQGICPAGWHLPTDDEWIELTDFLGGASVAGGKLKETGTAHWVDPNTGATNESGFTALGGGSRGGDGYIMNIKWYNTFWSSTENGGYGAWEQTISYNKSDISRWYYYYYDGWGFSVRCLRDSSQFNFLTISDKSFKTVSNLNFNSHNPSEEILIVNSSVGRTIDVSSIYSINSAFNLNYSPAILFPGDIIHLTITFNPSVKEIYLDTLFILSDDPYNSQITIPLIGTFPLEVSFTDSTNISCTGYSDGFATVTPSLGTPPYQYQWDDDEITTDSIVTDLKANIYYHVIVTDDLGETVEDSIILSEPEQPLYVLSDYSDFICLNSNDGFINLNPSGGTSPYNYTWSNGAVTQNISGLPAGNYNVTVTDNNGCENLQEFVINSVVPYGEEKICIVTIDLMSGKNILVWEKTPDKGIATYNIYREFDIGQFTYIGSRDVDNLSIFRDETANPESRSYLYKITVTDTCGNESSLESSPYHWPSFLQYVSSEGGINLSWTDYKIEGIDNIGDYLSSYVVYRGTDSTGLNEYEVVGRQLHFTDKDLDALVRKYYYRVAGILKDPCYPTASSGKKDEPGPYNYSMSNIEDNRILTGLPGDLSKETLSIYPNPFGENTILTFNNPDGHSYTLYIMDLSGKVCRIVDNINTSRYDLEKGDMEDGFYIIELRGPELYRGRIIVE